MQQRIPETINELSGNKLKRYVCVGICWQRLCTCCRAGRVYTAVQLPPVKVVSMSKQDIENIKKGFSDGVIKAYDTAVGVEAQINDATANFSSAVRKSLSFGLEQYSATRSRLEVRFEQ
jgi:hypothetical protein